MSDYQVVVIGAGPGGIFAAYELMQRKPELKVAVFEAGHALDKRHCPIDGDKILCVKKGVVAADKPCWKFKYDPCKRVPVKAKALDFKKYDDEDFSL